jgi:HEPN domain-containing protein
VPWSVPPPTKDGRSTAVSDDEAQPSAEEAVRWLVKAVDDLAVAELVLASPVGVNWAACFHAQQAAAKALKAALVNAGTDFPRTHVLELIADLLPLEVVATLDRQALIMLSPWAVAGRYPEDIADPSDDATSVMVLAARAVVAAVERHIGDDSK